MHQVDHAAENLEKNELGCVYCILDVLLCLFPHLGIQAAHSENKRHLISLTNLLYT